MTEEDENSLYSSIIKSYNGNANMALKGVCDEIETIFDEQEKIFFFQSIVQSDLLKNGNTWIN